MLFSRPAAPHDKLNVFPLFQKSLIKTIVPPDSYHMLDVSVGWSDTVYTTGLVFDTKGQSFYFPETSFAQNV